MNIDFVTKEDFQILDKKHQNTGSAETNSECDKPTDGCKSVHVKKLPGYRDNSQGN